MATSATSHSTGAAQENHDIRRRNVPGKSDSNGNITHSPERYDNKKTRKVIISMMPSQHVALQAGLVKPALMSLLTCALPNSLNSQSCRYSTNGSFSTRPSYSPSFPSSRECTG